MGVLGNCRPRLVQHQNYGAVTVVADETAFADVIVVFRCDTLHGIAVYACEHCDGGGSGAPPGPFRGSGTTSMGRCNSKSLRHVVFNAKSSVAILGSRHSNCTSPSPSPSSSSSLSSLSLSLYGYGSVLVGDGGAGGRCGSCCAGPPHSSSMYMKT